MNLFLRKIVPFAHNCQNLKAQDSKGLTVLPVYREGVAPFTTERPLRSPHGVQITGKKGLVEFCYGLGRPTLLTVFRHYESKQCRSRRSPSFIFPVGIAPYPSTMPGRTDLATAKLDIS